MWIASFILSWKLVGAWSKIWKQSTEHKAWQCSEFCRCLKMWEALSLTKCSRMNWILMQIKINVLKQLSSFTLGNMHIYVLYFWHFLWELRNTVFGLISDVHYGEWNIISSLLITGIPTSQIKPIMAGALCLMHTVLIQHSPSQSTSPCHSSQFSIKKQKELCFML